MVIREVCPACGSKRYKKNGHARHGNQHHQCKTCERQLSASAAILILTHERHTLIANLLRERISLRGVGRAMDMSLPWLLHCMVECVAACPDDLHVQLPTTLGDGWIRQLEAEADEMGSFVEKKAHKQWRWLAMDAKSR